ncbi:hypothetical protein [Massilia aurea]|uniref:hypothetical protein n=1 Tax=Massilia aurea TaxID=373040 RepID=UPI0011CE71F0|nr:hypothetical protein [Massilia aurea]
MQAITQIECLILSNSSLLKNYESGMATDENVGDDVSQLVLSQLRSSNPSLPHHVLARRWEAFISHQSSEGKSLLLRSLSGLSSRYLLISKNKVEVKLELFGEWQNIMSRIGGSAVVAYAIVDSVSSNNISAAYEDVSKVISGNGYLRPLIPEVEQYIQDIGLNDVHMHLGGATPAKICWHRALVNPVEEIQDFSNGILKPSVARLVACVDPDLTPSVLLRRLRTASVVRSALINYCVEGVCEVNLHKILESDEINRDVNFHSGDVISTKLFGNESGNYEIAEIAWICLILKRLIASWDQHLAVLLHYYLLVQAQHLQLLVHREDMVGFDAFQAVTYTTLRGNAEKIFYDRFSQLHGKYANSQIRRLEARFAPLRKWKQIEKILTTILVDYLKYRNFHSSEARNLGELIGCVKSLPENRKFMQLTLVLHFLKAEWLPAKGMRHASLRSLLKEQVDAVVHGIRLIPSILDIVRGVDAAANELYAGPDIFAPIFRICANVGLVRKTYHVGEEFDHILTGIGSVIDAVFLLDLKNGDRLGHAIAIGISPERWLRSMPSELFVKRGEWFVALLSSWVACRERHGMQEVAARLLAEVNRCAEEIFEESLSIELLVAFSRHRGLWPKFVNEAFVHGKIVDVANDEWQSEIERVRVALKENSGVLSLLSQWSFDENLFSRSEELIGIRSDFLGADELNQLQQAVSEILVEKGIIVETLPTSNVRMTAYQNIEDHHVFRWLKIGDNSFSPDPVVKLALGSDDPGIFATDLASEIYLIYSVMMTKHKFEKHKALSCLYQLNESSLSAVF